MTTGIILKALSGFYYVDVGDNLIECHARGLFRKTGDSPLVGDYVDIEILSDGTGVIKSIKERKNSLNRPPIANIDKIFIVSSYTSPAPNTYIIDSMTAIAEDKGIKPIIVFNKCDMGDFSEFVSIYEKCGYPVFVVSAQEQNGLDALRDELAGSVSVFAGNTGVGKSSILNALFAELS